MKLSSSYFVSTLFAISSVQGFQVNSSSSNISRREAWNKVISSSAAVVLSTGAIVLPKIAYALPSEESPRVVNRMGGLLVSLEHNIDYILHV